MSEGQLEFVRVPTANLYPRDPVHYEDTGLVGYLETKLLAGQHLILRGPKGTGKTVAIERLCAKLSLPMLRHPCTEDDTSRDLFGGKMTDGRFMLGPATAAINVANETGACVLVLEEVNALNPRAQKALNPLTDYRQEVGLQRIGHVFRVDEGAILWVVGTMNPSYGGVFDLNEDLKSRYLQVEVTYPSEDVEVLIMKNEYVRAARRSGSTLPVIPTDLEFKTLRRLAEQTRTDRVGYALSTRDLESIARSWACSTDLARALKEVENNYDGDARSGFRALVANAFPRAMQDLAKVTLY